MGRKPAKSRTAANRLRRTKAELLEEIERLERRLARFENAADTSGPDGKRAEEARVRELDDLRRRYEEQASNAARAARELSAAQNLLVDAIESVPEGFVLWDADDRLVLCNTRYREIMAPIGHLLEPGLAYADMLRHGLECGLMPRVAGTIEACVAHYLQYQQDAVGEREVQQSDGRWVHVTKRLTTTGSVVTILSDVTERKEAQAIIHRMALEDGLTGLPNRAAFHQRLEQALAQAQRAGAIIGVMLLDLDRFKEVNDTLGHPAGDALLKQVGARLRYRLRKSDTVARLGGDEFAVISTNNKDVKGVTVLAQRLIDALRQPFVVDGKEVHTGASVGITVFPFDDGTPDQLLRNADMALYRAAEDGGGSFRLFDERMNTEVRTRRSIENDLRGAIEREELHVHFQPQIELRDGRIIGAEALLRWQHPERGNIGPDQFIPIAESSRLIIPIGEWVLRTVCEHNKRWQRDGLGHFAVSVNISPLQFKQQPFPDLVAEILRQTGLAPGCLELEITESMTMFGGLDVARLLTRLKTIGVRLAIDDFGTGHSSLNYLKKFPVDRLKIDRSFVRDLATEWDDAAICSAVIRLGHSLNISVMAEGVETRDHLAFLIEQGCDEAQGYYFGRPMPADAFDAFVRTYDPSKALVQTSAA